MDTSAPDTKKPSPGKASGKSPAKPPLPVRETGGQEGPEPTRYGDWEKGGRCTDF